MELKHLRSFLVVADERHFGRAATRLHLAQSSLSQQMQRLERDLGAQLLVRSSREVGLTPAGEVLLAHGRAISDHVARARMAVREAAAGKVGTLRVGYNFPSSQDLLPAAMAKMADGWPKVDIALREMRTGPQLRAVSEGKIDVALVYGRPAAEDLDFCVLTTVPLVAVVGREHPLAGRGAVPFRELAGESCVLSSRELCPAMYDAIVSSAASSGVRLHVSHWVDDSGATAMMVATRPVVAFASSVRAQTWPSSKGPVAVALTDPTPTLEVCAVWRKADARAQLHAFVGCLTSPHPEGTLAC